VPKVIFNVHYVAHVCTFFVALSFCLSRLEHITTLEERWRITHAKSQMKKLKQEAKEAQVFHAAPQQYLNKKVAGCFPSNASGCSVYPAVCLQSSLHGMLQRARLR